MTLRNEINLVKHCEIHAKEVITSREYVVTKTDPTTGEEFSLTARCLFPLFAHTSCHNSYLEQVLERHGSEFDADGARKLCP